MVSCPQVFIIHADEDRERFVERFAGRLREDGVDARYDTEEIMPGDRLVEKIFDEGPDQSDIVVAVISRYSMGTQWVEDVLGSAPYHRIENPCRVIPIILDDCDVPASMKHTVYVRVPDAGRYDDVYDEIRALICRESRRSSGGTRPEYPASGRLQIPDLSGTENFILHIICANAMENDVPISVRTSGILPQIVEEGITETEFYDSIEVLHDRGYVIPVKRIGGDIPTIKVSRVLLEEYCRQCIGGYEADFVSVISAIVHKNQSMSDEIAADTGIKKPVVSHILKYLASLEHIRITLLLEGGMMVHPNNVVELKRLLR